MLLAADKLRWITTGACNLDCFYCHNEGQAKEDTFVRLRVLEQVADAVAAHRPAIKEVTISGGEPFLHPQLAEIVALAAGISDRVTMVSNGLLADSGRLERLAGAGLPLFDDDWAVIPPPGPSWLAVALLAAVLVAAFWPAVLAASGRRVRSSRSGEKA